MLALARPTPAHFGIFVVDIEKMTRFYTDLFGLTITDRGRGRTFKSDLVFMSASPDQHHQFVLASGRPPDAVFSTVMQSSFLVPSIQALRDIRRKALDLGATNMRNLNHGNALSIYFSDLEGNTVEVYMDTPYYVPQPHGDPLDLNLSDEEIMRETERICRSDPGFMPLEEWQKRFQGARQTL